MTRIAHPFGVTFNNIPIVNIRVEYVRYLNYLESGQLRDDLRRELGFLKTPYMIWLGVPEMFLTILLQRTISGLEAYLAHAVQFELARRGKASKQTAAAIDAATSSTRGGGPAGVFHASPSLAEKGFAMRRSAQSPGARQELVLPFI